MTSTNHKHIRKNAKLIFRMGGKVELFNTVSASGLCSCKDENCSKPGKHPLTFDGERRFFSNMSKLDAVL
jgi:hypothetical protein